MGTLVLVKHYMRADLTQRCVRSLVPTLDHDDKLVVIDGSYDLAPYDGEEVEIVSWHGDGLISSFNDIIRYEDEARWGWDVDAYACLNNDVEVGLGWLGAIKTVLARNPQIGICAPLYDDPQGGWLWASGPMGQPHEFREFPHVDNCAWVFTEKLVQAIGLPDPAFTGAGWGANLDYCYRARKAGFLVAAALGAWVHHEGAATFGVDPEYRAKARLERDRVLQMKYGARAAEVWG